jgi:hypothetical protein
MYSQKDRKIILKYQMTTIRITHSPTAGDISGFTAVKFIYC